MRSIERIIKIIDEGKSVPVFADDAVVEDFHELLKFGLIRVMDDRIVLTSEGEEARKLGFERIVNQLRSKEELKDFCLERQQWELKLLLLCVGLSLILTAAIFFWLIE